MLQDIYSLLDDFMQPKCYRVRNLGNVLKCKVLHCMALKLKNLPCKPDYWPTFALYLIAAANNSATLSTDIDFLIIFSQSFLSLSSQYESAKSKSPTKKKKLEWKYLRVFTMSEWTLTLTSCERQRTRSSKQAKLLTFTVTQMGFKPTNP